MKLTKELCADALDELWGIAYNNENMDIDAGAVFHDVIEQLIEEHFSSETRVKTRDNPPLKFEELKEGMWVWDNLKKEYIQIEFLDKGIPGYKYLNAITVPSNEYERLYSNNRFYRREVKDVKD